MAQSANARGTVRVAAASRTLSACSCLLGLLCFAALAAAADDVPSSLAIVGATVIHPERGAAAAVAPDTTIVIHSNRIQAVGPSRDTPIPPNARIVDAHGKWVIPGLVDAHVHFFQSGNLYARPDIAGVIAPGRLADLVILDADPLGGIENLSAIDRVVKDGRMFDPDELIRSLH